MNRGRDGVRIQHGVQLVVERTGALHHGDVLRDPRERRIRAAILSLFQGDAYFMLDQRRLALHVLAIGHRGVAERRGVGND